MSWLALVGPRTLVPGCQWTGRLQGSGVWQTCTFTMEMGPFKTHNWMYVRLCQLWVPSNDNAVPQPLFAMFSAETGWIKLPHSTHHAT